MARQVGLCMAVTLALAGIALAMVIGGLLGVWCGVVGGATLGLVGAAQAVSRDAKVRKLVVTALGCDANVVNVKLLATVLGTPDVLEARRDHLSREAAIMAQRYANGDASDY